MIKTPMRSKRAYAWRQKKTRITNPLLQSNSLRTREFKCAKCGARFPDYLARCPECGSEEWEELAEVNPYTRMPMESFLKSCGHMFWILGTVGFLALLWQTGGNDAETNQLFAYGAIAVIFIGVLFSAFYFALSELLRRTLRIQRRLRAFHDTYRISRVQHLGMIGKTRLRRLG